LSRKSGYPFQAGGAREVEVFELFKADSALSGGKAMMTSG
jgi:hypothetical protein